MKFLTPNFSKMCPLEIFEILGYIDQVEGGEHESGQKTEDRTTLRRAEGPRDATSCRETARRYGVQRDRAMLRHAERPRDATWCRDRATPRRAEGPRDATACATSRGADRPRDATWCRLTARRHIVWRDRATPRRAKEPRDATWC